MNGFVIVRKSKLNEKDEQIKRLNGLVKSLSQEVAKCTPKRGSNGKFIPKNK